MKYERIEINPHVMLGKPVIRGTRLSVAFVVGLMADGWTVVTMDGKWSAQFEHSIAITKDGPRILTTLPPNGHLPL